MKLYNYYQQSNLKTYLPVVLLAFALSIAGLWYFSNMGVITAYNDARSHLNLSRFVFDNQKPGLAQLGGVWLPLQHWLMLPFIWSRMLWQTGLAGSIVSMFGYIVSAAGIFALAHLITGRKSVSWLASLVFLLNVNIWYMQSVPMSESLLLMFFILTTYCLSKWAMTQRLSWLIFTALSLVGSTLTRYDGWFLFIWVSLSVMVILAYWVKKGTIERDQALAWGVAFLTLASVGILFWLGWNLAIYGDPLYFLNGPYSAKSQQETIAASSNLYTDHNLRLSLKAYGWAALNNVGLVGIGLLIMGIILWPQKWRQNKWSLLVPATALLSPFVFHVLSLYRGHSILMTPELNLIDPKDPSSAWFNVRYGLIMLPAAAIWGTYFIKNKTFQFIVVILLLAQSFTALASSNITTLTDATVGSSGLRVSQEAGWLAQRADKDDLIMTSVAFHNAFIYETGIPLKQFVHEGTDKLWEEMLLDPSSKVEWIVMMNGDVDDPLYNAFIKNNQGNFSKHYTIAHRGNFLNIYRRSDFVTTENAQLMYKGKPLKFVGVNSYDLLYQSPKHMRETIRKGKRYGFNVYRFWAFGEGFSGSMQPQAGIINNDVMLRLDILLSIARQENVKLVPVLGNYWSDYGGVSHYLGWLGLRGNTLEERNVFFMHPDAKALYRNYIEKIVNRQNVVTGREYKKDETILAWELINEPRSAKRYDQMIIKRWQQEMTDYIKSIDTHHPVISGVEGFVDGQYEDPAGPDMVIGNNAANIDIASGHLYRKYLIDPDSKQEFRGVIETWSENARELNKPLIIGEVGFPRSEDSVRREWYQATLEEIKESNVSGVFLWNFAMHTGEPYTVSPEVEQDRQLLKSLDNLIPDTRFSNQEK